MAKTLLMAMFTYQLAYFGWVKLDTDEVRAEKTGMYWMSTCYRRN